MRTGVMELLRVKKLIWQHPKTSNECTEQQGGGRPVKTSEIAVIPFLPNNTLASSCVKKDLPSSLHRPNTPAVCCNRRYWVSDSLLTFRAWNAVSVFSFSSYLSAGKIFNQTQDVSNVSHTTKPSANQPTILCNGCHLMPGKVTALTEGKDQLQ